MQLLPVAHRRQSCKRMGISCMTEKTPSQQLKVAIVVHHSMKIKKVVPPALSIIHTLYLALGPGDLH